jgi:hypothetical protein
MALETGMFVLALLVLLVGLPLTALHIYVLAYPESKIGKKFYPPSCLLRRLRRARAPQIPHKSNGGTGHPGSHAAHHPVLELQNVELVTTARPRRRGANYA